MDSDFAGKAIAARYTGRTDLDQMPDTPTRRTHHRRAQSETFFRFPDDILLDDVVGDFNLVDIMSSDTETNAAPPGPMAIDSAKSDSSNGCDAPRPKTRSAAPPISHFRSLSVGADFFEGLEFNSGGGGADGDRYGGKPPPASPQGNYRSHHRHSNSMDGSSSSFEAESFLDGMKKSMGPDRLAELALIDPKRAKRILANRQSAARSKERKIRYTGELERKVQTLQTEATTLSAQVTMLQRDTSGLTAENRELKLRLQAMEQEAHLRDALNEALREEVQRLKLATGQGSAAANGNNPFSRALPPQFSSSSQQQMFHRFNNPGQQLPQQQLPSPSQSATNNSPTSNAQPPPPPSFVRRF